MEEKKEKEIHNLKKEIIYLNCLLDVSNEAARLVLQTNSKLIELIKNMKEKN